MTALKVRVLVDATVTDDDEKKVSMLIMIIRKGRRDSCFLSTPGWGAFMYLIVLYSHTPLPAPRRGGNNHSPRIDVPHRG